MTKEELKKVIKEIKEELTLAVDDHIKTVRNLEWAKDQEFSARIDMREVETELEEFERQLRNFDMPNPGLPKDPATFVAGLFEEAEWTRT